MSAGFATIMTIAVAFCAAVAAGSAPDPYTKPTALAAVVSDDSNTASRCLPMDDKSTCGTSQKDSTSLDDKVSLLQKSLQVDMLETSRKDPGLIPGRSTDHSAVKGNPSATALMFVVLADPQLGLKHCCDKGGGPDPATVDDWKNELDMFTGLVKAAKAEKPAFIFLAGDMQDAWENTEKANATRGAAQRKDLKTALDEGAGGLKVYYTGGNHDVGDVPDAKTTKLYQKSWNTQLYSSFQKDGVLFVQFTSQFYWDHSLAVSPPQKLDEDMEKVKAAQTKWLDGELAKVTTATKGVVVLTHIPPFMEKHDEKAGWANWQKGDRLKILDMFAAHLTGKNVPISFVCGHFHTNVKNLGYTYTSSSKSSDKIKFDIVVVSSSGSTMWWDGANGDGHLSPNKAAEVAMKPVKDAFTQDILTYGTKKWDGKAKWVIPEKTRSGLATFTLGADGKFASVWKTLAHEEKAGKVK